MATKPGWYRDPKMSGTARYWDGLKWTNHTKAIAVDPAAATTAAPAEQARPTTVGPLPAAAAPRPVNVPSNPAASATIDLNEPEKPAFRFTQSSRVRTKDQFIRVAASVAISMTVGLSVGVGIGALQYPNPSPTSPQVIVVQN